jgi:hypothetical protein
MHRERIMMMVLIDGAAEQQPSQPRPRKCALPKDN